MWRGKISWKWSHSVLKYSFSKDLYESLYINYNIVGHQKHWMIWGKNWQLIIFCQIYMPPYIFMPDDERWCFFYNIMHCRLNSLFLKKKEKCYKSWITWIKTFDMLFLIFYSIHCRATRKCIVLFCFVQNANIMDKY